MTDQLCNCLDNECHVALPSGWKCRKETNSSVGGNATAVSGAVSASSHGKTTANDGVPLSPETGARTSNPISEWRAAAASYEGYTTVAERDGRVGRMYRAGLALAEIAGKWRGTLERLERQLRGYAEFSPADELHRTVTDALAGLPDETSRDVTKEVALMALCAVQREHGSVMHPNLAKDVQMAIDGLRPATEPGETISELERLRKLQETALALDDAVAEFGIDKPQYISEVYQAFHDELHTGHGAMHAVEPSEQLPTETGLRPGELAQLRRIDAAARFYVDSVKPGSGVAWENLMNALFDGRPEETECNHPRSALLARKGDQFEMHKCLDCTNIFRVRLPENGSEEHK